MDDFLTPVSTKVKRSPDIKPSLQEGQISQPAATGSEIHSPDEALRALKEQPDLGTVSSVLRYLAAEADKKDGFSLMTIDPRCGNIAYQLVNTTIPDYWRVIGSTGLQARQLVRCLRNPCGIGTIVTRLRALMADCRQKKPVGNTSDPSFNLEDSLGVLDVVLRGDRCVTQTWTDVQSHAKNATQGQMIWKDFIMHIASGRILSLAAEAEDVLKERKSSHPTSWLANGNEYASWLGRNIAGLLRETKEPATAAIDICVKSLTLGYTDRIISSLIPCLIDANSIESLPLVLHKMKPFEQRKFLNAVVSFVSKQYFKSTIESKEDAPLAASATVSAAATLIYSVAGNSDLMKDLVSALINAQIPALDDSLSARRSVIVAVAQDEDQLHSLLENSLKLFGDPIYVKHTPILQQESLAQTVAITSGYVQRSQPMFLTMMAKSSYHVSGMSNRIGSTSPRARLLGMMVGIAISKMVDKPELQLKFDLEATEEQEAKWYQRLTQVHDELGKTEDLKIGLPNARAGPSTSKPDAKRPKASKATTNPAKVPAVTEVKGPRIIEVLSDSEGGDDDDLVPYAKPDSDPEDDTDDPTALNRNKPTAPVYIRDLLSGLRNQEDPDVHALALSTAGALIRRKSAFGTEVTDHMEELATLLVGLNDNFELEGFDVQRQQAVIALLLAKPAVMAPWFARACFTGDYSLSQRTAMLTTLALGARELAGFKDEATEALLPPAPSFPSSQLAPHLHDLYTQSINPTLARLASSTSKQLLAPMAASAADALTGPAVLKTRTFSSRLSAAARRPAPAPNVLAQIVADAFFFPLTSRWSLAARASSSSSSIYTSPLLLPQFLHTLALILQAAGPHAPALPQMTAELWDLLLGVRAAAQDDRRVLGAHLFALLVLLETNEDKERVATEHGTRLVETQAWVQSVFEGLAGAVGRAGVEDDRVRVLAAGVAVRCQEVVEKYQRRLVGSMLDY